MSWIWNTQKKKTSENRFFSFLRLKFFYLCCISYLILCAALLDASFFFFYSPCIYVRTSPSYSSEARKRYSYSLRVKKIACEMTIPKKIVVIFQWNLNTFSIFLFFKKRNITLTKRERWSQPKFVFRSDYKGEKRVRETEKNVYL